jgi:hypothetical protein
LERIHHSQKTCFASDFLLARQAVANGTTTKTSRDREKYWKCWAAYATSCKIDPFLEKHLDDLEREIIISGFAARVRQGYYGHGDTVKVSTVATALAAISKTIELAGKRSPIYKDENNNYSTNIQRMMEGFRREDPPTIPQLAVPVTVPNLCYDAGHKDGAPLKKTIGNLCLIAFYYLLRVGEYTKPRYATRKGKRIRATRTVQFTVGSVGFFKDGKVISRDAPLDILLACDSATLKITNQKNGRMGQVIHQEAVPTSKYNPIAALAHQVHHILSNGGTTETLLCTYFDNGTENCVTSKQIVKAVRTAAKLLKLQNVAIDPDLVGSHSLRSGGAMALRLHGEEATTIMKLGRWTSTTFLDYIHTQIAHLSNGVSTRMSEEIPFLNIAAF